MPLSAIGCRGEPGVVRVRGALLRPNGVGHFKGGDQDTVRLSDATASNR